MNQLKALACCIVLCLLFLWVPGTHANEILIGYSGPFSGPAADYGQDCASGIELAVKELNRNGGLTIKGVKYSFKLDKRDDCFDSKLVLENVRQFRAKKAIAVFGQNNNITRETGPDFIPIVMTSSPGASQTNKLIVITSPPLNVFAQAYVDWAWERGWRRLGIILGSNSNGNAWTWCIKSLWEKKGGIILGSRPANYYQSTDFTPQIREIMTSHPDVLLVGGPSPTTALLIEQARKLGFRGGFMLIDQAKLDMLAKLLGGTQLIQNAIGVAKISSFNSIPVAADYFKKYSAEYKRVHSWDALLSYAATLVLAKAITESGQPDNPEAIRASYSRIFPMVGGKNPIPIFGISEKGRQEVPAFVQTVRDGKLQEPVLYAWWPRDSKEYEKAKRDLSLPIQMRWIPFNE